MVQPGQNRALFTNNSIVDRQLALIEVVLIKCRLLSHSNNREPA